MYICILVILLLLVLGEGRDVGAGGMLCPVMHTESRGQLWRASSLPPPSHQCEQLDLGHQVPFPAEPSHQHRLCILIWGISCRCLISSALISSNEHFPSYPNAFISSRHYVHSLVPARLQFPLLFSVAGEICHLMSLMGLGKFSLFLLMRKKDSLLLPLVRLKSLLSARRFMRPQSPRDNMRKSWSTWESMCVERISGECALVSEGHTRQPWKMPECLLQSRGQAFF